MADILARIKTKFPSIVGESISTPNKIDKECLNEKIIIKTPENRDVNIIDKQIEIINNDAVPSNPSIINSSSKNKEIAIYNTEIISRTRANQLVWSKCLNFKGSNSYICSKICDYHEVAAEYVPGLEDSVEIPVDKVIVEYFNLPKSISRFGLVDKDNVVPYYLNPLDKNNRIYEKDLYIDVSEYSEWNNDGFINLTKVLKKRYTINQSETISETIQSTARLYLQKAIALELSIQSIKASPNKIKTKSNPIKEKASVDLMKYSMKRVEDKDKVELKVNDWIEYLHPVLKLRTERCKIIEITNEKLKLSNGESLTHDSRILLLQSDGNGGYIAGNNEDYRAIEDFILVNGKVDIKTNNESNRKKKRKISN